MTTDKIKHHIGPQLFKHWQGVNNPELLRRAQAQLTTEIEQGLLHGVKYIAELELINMKLKA